MFLFVNCAPNKINVMINLEYTAMLKLQKILYFNVYLSICWFIVIAWFLYVKLDLLGHLMKYLSVAVFTMLVVIETIRLYLGHFGNLLCKVPELAGFLMLSVLMQIPLVSFFLFNPYLLSTPTEITLHAMLWSVTMVEAVIGLLALKKASLLAKSMYFS